MTSSSIKQMDTSLYLLKNFLPTNFSLTSYWKSPKDVIRLLFKGNVTYN